MRCSKGEEQFEFQIKEPLWDCKEEVIPWETLDLLDFMASNFKESTLSIHDVDLHQASIAGDFDPTTLCTRNCCFGTSPRRGGFSTATTVYDHS